MRLNVTSGGVRNDYLTIMKGIRPHFQKRYLADEDNIYRGVSRPNHSLHHGLRQGFLALDICTIFVKNNLGWLSCELQEYQGDYFYIQALASFQRSGRESEGPSEKYL